MFTGIIQHVGRVLSVSAAPRRGAGGAAAHRLDVDLGPLAENLAPGASVAINGVCLTAAGQRGTAVAFDVVPETWRRTTLATLRPADEVNLERSARLGDPVEGHLVQGHVEAAGEVVDVDRAAGQWKLWTRVPAELIAAIVPKGSVALDGTSLTVVDVQDDRFSVVLVPTTLERTVLRHRQRGSHVNVETDILARLVAQRLAWLADHASTRGITLDALRAGGFMP